MPSDATQFLHKLEAGDDSAAERLLPLVYDELRALAESAMRREAPGHTLQPTALVHEAYLKLIEQHEVNWQSRSHFLAIAATLIRRILVDHARKRHAQKRGGDRQRLTLANTVSDEPVNQIDLIALDEALDTLETLHRRQARIVQLRFFGGLTEQETAHILEVSRTTIADDWSLARAWLSRELAG